MLNEMQISKLEAMGGKRWQKGNYDRIYLNWYTLGLECDYYKTGNIHHATLRGHSVSNSEARRIKNTKTYIDVATGEAHSQADYLADIAREILAEIAE